MSKCHRLGEAEKLRAVLEKFLNKMMIYLVVRVFPITSLQKVHNRIPTYKFLHIRGTSVSIFFCLKFIERATLPYANFTMRLPHLKPQKLFM